MSDLTFPTLPPAPPAPAAPSYPQFTGSPVIGFAGNSLLYAVSANTLNRTARSTAESQQTIGGTNTVIPLVYGTAYVGGRIAAIKVDSGGHLVALVVWCLGEVDSVVETRINDEATTDAVTVTSYTGTTSQTADATMVATFSGYSDALAGVCYSVFKLSPLRTTGFPRFTAKINGMKVRATSGGARAYSDNPAYALADLIESTTYGLGRSVDWATVATLASACDALVGGEKKRIINLVLDQSLPGAAWLQTLRDYAGCFVIPEGASYRLVPDTTGSSVKSFTAANIVAGSVRLQKRGTLASPTMIEVAYTDTSVVPWREATYTTPVVTPRRLSRISKPGITRYSEAKRYATERLNESVLNDLTINFTAFDEALELQAGDLMDVTHPLGLTAKVFRVASIAPAGPGRWSIVGSEYDAAKYDSTAATAPTTVDTTLASPSSPPALSGLAATEQTYQLETGVMASRVRVTWTAPTYPYVGSVRVTVAASGTEVHTGTALHDATGYTTPALQEGVAYTVTAAIVSTVGVTGTAATQSVTLTGKAISPGNVLTLTGFEAGGRVFLYWSQADNPTNPGTPDPDIWRYEIRRGLTSGSWATATVVDRVDALAYVVEGSPAGDWRFYVAAVDSVQQYSATPKTLDVTVTLDAGAFLASAYTFTSPTLTNLTAYTLRPDATTYYISDHGDGLGYGADNTDNAVGTFGDSLAAVPFASPHTAGSGTWLSESWDAGAIYTGNWTGAVTYTDLVGTATATIETSSDGSSWTTTWPGLTAKTAARFARVKVTTTGAMRVASGATVQLAATPREETGTITTVASGASTVTLSNKYATAKSIQLTPTGTTSRQAVYDAVTLSTTGTNSFAVYLFNSAGTQIAGDVSWVFKGV